mgnify:CR=1 FL=1
MFSMNEILFDHKYQKITWLGFVSSFLPLSSLIFVLDEKNLKNIGRIFQIFKVGCRIVDVHDYIILKKNNFRKTK